MAPVAMTGSRSRMALHGVRKIGCFRIVKDPVLANIRWDWKVQICGIDRTRQHGTIGSARQMYTCRDARPLSTPCRLDSLSIYRLSGLSGLSGLPAQFAYSNLLHGILGGTLVCASPFTKLSCCTSQYSACLKKSVAEAVGTAGCSVESSLQSC
jgi:hypothetical protein